MDTYTKNRLDECQTETERQNVLAFIRMEEKEKTRKYESDTLPVIHDEYDISDDEKQYLLQGVHISRIIGKYTIRIRLVESIYFVEMMQYAMENSTIKTDNYDDAYMFFSGFCNAAERIKNIK